MIWNSNKKAIYLINEPYVKYTTRYDSYDFSYTEFNLYNLNLMDKLITTFMINSLNIKKKIKELKNADDINATVISQLVTFNKAYLIEQNEYIRIFNFLKDVDPNDRDVTLIINFYTDIASSIDNESLFKYINNLYNSLETISRDVKSGTRTTWSELHETYPYLWLFIKISHLLLREKYSF